jgi:hypothetical protein
MSSQILDQLSGGRIPHPDNLVLACRGQAASVRVESDGINRAVMVVEGEAFLAGAGVPHVDDSILAGGRESAAVRAESHGVNRTVVTAKAVLLQAGWEFPEANGPVFAEAREQRGIIIAATCRIGRTNGVFVVPSQSAADRKYEVNLERRTCTCPDCQEGGFKCKHQFAVEITLKRELGVDGSITETKTLSVTEKKVYKQDWRAYNHAQATEKPRFQVLLKELCLTVPEREFNGRGRQPHTYRDSIFSMVYKVYSTFSSRRFSSDLLDAYERGHLSRTVPGIKVNSFFENPVFTPILKRLIGVSAMPLRAVESDFAVDSSGFSTCKFERWYDEKYGKTKKQSVWVKAHIATREAFASIRAVTLPSTKSCKPRPPTCGRWGMGRAVLSSPMSGSMIFVWC